METRLLNGTEESWTRSAFSQVGHWSFHGYLKGRHGPQPISIEEPCCRQIWGGNKNTGKNSNPLCWHSKVLPLTWLTCASDKKNPFVNCESSIRSTIHNLLGQENILIFTKPPTNLFLLRKCFDLTRIYSNVDLVIKRPTFYAWLGDPSHLTSYLGDLFSPL